MGMTTLSDLELLARAATPGPWRNAKEWAESRSSFEHVYAGMPDGPGQTVAQWVLPHDAAYLAACSPERILALVAVARAAKEFMAAAHPHRSLADMQEVLAALEAM